MYFLKTWKMAFAAVHFLWIHEWNSVPRILSLVLFILQASFKTHCWSEKHVFKRKLNLKSQQCHYKNLFPKNKCTHCGSSSSPKDNFHFNFLPFLPLNQFCFLCDFLFVITDYKSMYLLLPAATVNSDVQYMQKSIFTEHELLFLV